MTTLVAEYLSNVHHGIAVDEDARGEIVNEAAAKVTELASRKGAELDGALVRRHLYLVATAAALDEANRDALARVAAGMQISDAGSTDLVASYGRAAIALLPEVCAELGVEAPAKPAPKGLQ